MSARMVNPAAPRVRKRRGSIIQYLASANAETPQSTASVIVTAHASQVEPGLLRPVCRALAGVELVVGVSGEVFNGFNPG